MPKNAKIYVAGHRGMVGSTLVRRLESDGYTRVVTRTRAELDLLDQQAVAAFLAQEQPDYIFIAAAKVGGIQANNLDRADFLRENLLIEANLLRGAHLVGVQRLMLRVELHLSPRLSAADPRGVSAQPTNEPYAITKIAGIKLAESYNRQHGRQYVSVMPTNLYGPNDDYDLANSHVLSALLRKAHEAKVREDYEYVVWGSGTPKREFLYVDDLADACVHLMEIGYDGPLRNIGTGVDVTIRELAETVMDVIGFRGKITIDATKPDGTPRKLLDVSRLTSLGWSAETELCEGIQHAYRSALIHLALNGLGKYEINRLYADKR